MAGCPIRISADLRSFAPTRGFSQLITSFFASKSLGIPRAPFVTFLTIYGIAYRYATPMLLLHFLSQYVNELLSRLFAALADNNPGAIRR